MGRGTTRPPGRARGKGPEAHVRLALWCERHGLQDERVRNLALAVSERPDDAQARGLLGMVKVDGRWHEAAEAAARPVPGAMAKYEARRAAMNPDRAEEHWQLALWCERNGLSPEARAHLAAVVRLEPSREAAWRHLGFRRHRGRWMTPEQIDASIADARARQEADRHWGPVLQGLRSHLHQGGAAAQEAEAALAAVRDPRAVPGLWEVFVVRSRHAEDHARAVGVLARIDSHEATLRLARLAVSSPRPPVASAAAEALHNRDPREVIDALVDMLRAPVAFQVVPGNGGVVGELQVEGHAFNIERFYVLHQDDNPLFELNAQPVTRSGLGPAGMGVTQTNIPARAVADYRSARLDAQAAVRRDTAMLERFNASILDSNERIDAMLRRLTGHDVREDPPLKDVLARAEKAREDQTRDFIEARERSRRESEETNRESREIMAQISSLGAQIREIALAQRMATNPQDRAVLAERSQALSRQIQEIGVAQSAEAQVRQARAAEEARQADWKAKREPVEREEARNEAWRRWWTNERGYSSDQPQPRDKPTVVQVQAFDVPVVLIPGQTVTGLANRLVSPGPYHHSCFAVGTPVHTRTGYRPIEDLKVGDLVLSRDAATGALSYQAITTVYHRRPAPTCRVALGGEALVVTGIHRFWKAGTGWTMARDLKSGDPIRAVDGVRTVESVRPDEVRPVYNLDVDRTRSFLVGRAGAWCTTTTSPSPWRPHSTPSPSWRRPGTEDRLEPRPCSGPRLRACFGPLTGVSADERGSGRRESPGRRGSR